MPTFHPSCLWYEDDTHVSITLDHPDMQIHDLQVSEDRVVLRKASCEGREYAMDLPLFGKVQPTYATTATA